MGMSRKTVAKKIISLVLVFCMVFTSLPLSAFAAEAEANRAMSEQVALYMLELGLVDDQGDLIYDNSFTVEDGTKLANLDELLDWLLECPDDEVDTLITVDATGKTATAEWIITAINIETQMELLTGGLNQLASGAVKSGRAVAVESAVSEKDLQAHNVYLVSKVVSGQEEDIMCIRVGVSDSYDGSFTTNHGEIQIEAGLFCDFLVRGAHKNLGVHVTDSTNPLYANSYAAVNTLGDGQEYVEFKIDLANLRNLITGQNIANNEQVSDISYRTYEQGLWGGAVPVLFQCRISGGARQQSSNIKFSIAVENDRADAVVLLDTSQDVIYADAVVFEAAQSGNKQFYIKLNTSDVTEVDVNGTKYYKFSVPELYGKLRGINGSSAKRLAGALKDIYYMSGQDGESFPTINVEGAALVAASGDSSDSMKNWNLYYSDSDSEVSLKTVGSSRNFHPTQAVTIEKIAAVCNGAATYSDSNSDMKSLKDQITNKTRRCDYWANLQWPTMPDRNNNMIPVTEFYVAKNWITDSNGNSKDRKPEYFCMWGTLKVDDTTAPSVLTYPSDDEYWVEDATGGVTWCPGDLIPITATFTEPIVNDMLLVYQNGDVDSYLGSENATYGTVYGSVAPVSSDMLGNGRDISRHRTFYYEVQTGDEGVSILGVKSAGNGNYDDVAGNALQTTTGYDYLRFDEAKKVGDVLELKHTDLIEGLTVTQDADDPLVAHVKVTVDNSTTAFRNKWANYNDGDFYVVLDYARSTELSAAAKYPLIKSEEPNSDGGNDYVLTCDIPLDNADAGKIRTAEIGYDITIHGPDDFTPSYTESLMYYGAYGQFIQQALTSADENSYTVSVNGQWPSGVAGVVYADDADTPIFGYAENAGASYTYKGKDTLSWQTDAPDVIKLVENNNGATCTFVAQKAGTANIYLQSDNAGKIDTSVASNKITVTVKEGASPNLMIPNSASTLTVRSGDALQVAFYSNLSKYEAFEGDGKIVAKLYKGSDTTGTLVDTYTLERGATMLEIPASVLTDVSVGGVPAYAVQFTANAKQDDNQRKDFTALAKIVVNSQPAKITMTGLEETMFADTQSKNISWSIENFDSGDVDERGFEFVIEKKGNNDKWYKVTTPTVNGTYEFNPDPVADNQLKDTYLVMLKAKNNTDPSWSIASSTLTVYNADALKMWVGGEESKGTLTLQTKVDQAETTTAPTLTTYSGEKMSGLSDANAIAKLRAELTLMDTVSVNYEDYKNWSLLYDTFSWKAENVSTGQGASAEEAAEDVQQVLSINYRQSNYYQPIENFSNAYYLPETVFMLCGLHDGTAKVTATHKHVDKLSAELTVNVNRLKDKLYLFQFTPAIETTLSYTDGLGNKRVVTSNSDGSLALYEPNGIADDDLRLSSVMGGTEDYRGTVDVRSLRSGEGNGVERELYPLNAIELTRGAMVQFTLLKPDGQPLANTDITLRGGVYRNPDLVSNRDDAYCEDARFSKEFGKPADIPGTENIQYKTDANGVVTLYMDVSQFKSKVETGDAAISDNFRFIFELQANGYNPEIVICESGQTYKDVIRTGNNLLTLTKSDGEKPLVVVQTVDYYTGRSIDVRNHTGVIGPSPDYTALAFSTQLMLWGVDGVTTDDTGYKLDVRTQESAAALSGQKYRSVKQVSYPFSSIPLVENQTVIDKNTFTKLDGSKRIPLELALYDGNGALSRTVALPFGLVDVTSIQMLSTDQSLISLMASLIVFGEPKYEVGYEDGDENTKSTKNDGSTGDTLKGAAAELIDSMGELEQFGAKLGLVRTILMPTADPTIFSAYIWMGYDTTEMADLRYDEHGIYKEMTHIFQSEDQMSGTFFGKYTMSDFRAMSGGTYHEKWQEDNSDIAGLMFGKGGVMQGWMSTEVYYNFEKGKWQIVATGGGFTWGKQIELGGRPKQRFKPFPYNYSIKVRGGIVVSLDMAVRYAEQLGEKWNDETARAVNDYLTAIRINAYLEGYAGLGIDKGLVATVGVFGNVELNNENRILNRSYLEDSSRRKLKGSYVQLDGELGVRETFGIGPLTVEWTWFSYKLGDQWRFKKWNDIDEYWKNAASGFSGGLLDPGEQTQSLQADYGGQMAVAAGTSGVKMQSRDYLSNAKREWLGGSSVATMSLDENNKLEKVQTNAYPYSRPLVSDDGSILVYLSDKDSTDVQDVEVRFSLANQTAGMLYDDGTRIADPTDFAGYGDSALDFDGDADHAGAVWLREAATLNLKPDAAVDASQQLTLVNGLEVVASIWDGDKMSWATTRLTDNGTQEMSPIIAVSDDGDAIVAWREVQTNWQTGDDGVLESMDFGNSRILYKLYSHTDGTWSDTHTLYNGTSGAVKGMSVEMIDDTAVVAMALDAGVTAEEAENGKSASEIYYAVVDTTASDVEAETRVIRATTNDYLDEDPQLTTVEGADNDYFVLGWHSLQTETSVEQNDVGLRVLDMNGTPQSILPEALSNMVSTASFAGQFTFVKGAAALDELSLLWNDVKAGGENNDVIRAIKFGRYGEAYAASAPIEVAELEANNSLTHMDAYATGEESVYAMLQVTEYDTKYHDETIYVEDESGVKTETTVSVPDQTSKLLSATGTYEDTVAVIATNVDYDTLNTNAQVPVTFTVKNLGLHAITGLTLTVADASTGGATQTLTDLNLLPGQSKVVPMVITTGDAISDMTYTLNAEFDGAAAQTDTGTLYLDYPDVGISGLQVISEENGQRTFIATMYNQAAASLDVSNRRVVLGVYTDPSCTTGIDGKYFGGTVGKAYEIAIDKSADLQTIDADNFAKKLDFDIAQYIADAGQTEIPEQGIMLFVRARVEQYINGNWVELPEADTMNNQKTVTFDSLLTRSNNEPTTMTVELANADGKATAKVQVRNNSLQKRNEGHLLATLVDANGKMLETKNVTEISLGAEGNTTKNVVFGQTGAKVLLSYGEPVATAGAAVKNITVDGLPLTIDSFKLEDKDGKYYARVPGVPGGNYVLTVKPESDTAKVTVNGAVAENGIAQVAAGGEYEIVVTNGTDSRTYMLTLERKNAGAGGGGVVTPVEKPIETVTDMPFDDVKANDWFSEDVRYAWENGLMNGTAASSFEPNSNITRGMIVTILHRLAGEPKVTAENPFKDVAAGAYYTDAIIWAAEQGVVTGYDAATFGPNDSITREQMAAILWRYAKAEGADVSVGEDTNILSYDDALKVSEYAMAAMQWACGAGVINGVTESTLEPQGKATRAQTAAILHRYCTNVLGKADTDTK